jgi:hypothetical protein
VVKWASYKLDTTWTGWGKAETGSWKASTPSGSSFWSSTVTCAHFGTLILIFAFQLRVFEFGERFLDRLDFEEGALKRIDVKLAPPTNLPSDLTGAEREEAEAAWAKLEVCWPHIIRIPFLNLRP